MTSQSRTCPQVKLVYTQHNQEQVCTKKSETVVACFES